MRSRVVRIGFVLGLLLGMVPLGVRAANEDPIECTVSALWTAIFTASAAGGAHTIVLPENCVLSAGAFGNFSIPGNLDLTIKGNGAILDGGGQRRLFTLEQGASLRLQDVTLRNGSETGAGAIWAASGSTVYLERSTLENNKTSFGSGAIDVDNATLIVIDSVLKNNSAISPIEGRGGAIHATDSDVTLIGSELRGNFAGQEGGAIYAKGGTFWMERTTVVDNETGPLGQGNGTLYLSATEATVLASSIIQNTGGMVHAGDDLHIINSTIADNDRTQWGIGGGIRVDSGHVTLIKTTIANNKGQGGVYIYSSAANVNAVNTLFVQNENTNCAFISPTAKLTDGGHNLSTDSSCAFDAESSQQNVSNIGLAELADNGGPTPTMALAEDSPAIGAGNLEVCHDPETVAGIDQRGEPRPAESCSIGAFEPTVAPEPDPVPPAPYRVTPVGRQLPHGPSKSISWLPLAITDPDDAPVHSLFIATQLRPADAPDHAGQLGKRILLPIGKGQYLLLLTRRDQLQEPGDYVLTLYDLRTRTSHEILVTFSGD